MLVNPIISTYALFMRRASLWNRVYCPSSIRYIKTAMIVWKTAFNGTSLNFSVSIETVAQVKENVWGLLLCRKGFKRIREELYNAERINQDYLSRYRHWVLVDGMSYIISVLLSCYFFISILIFIFLTYLQMTWGYIGTQPIL